MSDSELACVYAALILHDDGLEISVSCSWLSVISQPLTLRRMAYSSCTSAICLVVQADNIQKLTAAANVKVEPYWPGLFSKLFANKSMDDLITNVGAGKHIS